MLKAADAAAGRQWSAVTAGGLLGAGLGIKQGNRIQIAEREGLMQRLADRTQVPMAPQTPGKAIALKPGHRMAGGLVGLLVGGALGAGVQQATMANSPAASMLAKMQSGQPMTAYDQMKLKQVLENTYNNIVG